MRHALRSRSLLTTATAVGLALTAVMAPTPVGAETDGFVHAENDRLDRRGIIAQVEPDPLEARQEVYAERAALMVRLDTARFNYAVRTVRWANYVATQKRVKRAINEVKVDRNIATNRANIARLEDKIAAVEAPRASTGTLEEFGLDFAVFPIDDTTEFVNSWGAPRSGGRGHKGTDILGPYGTELRAIEDGVIERTSNSALGGLSLYLQGDSGSRYFYAHLSQFADATDGDRVHAGDVIGYNGDSGNARGTPHLHFQWAPTGGESWINPYPMLEAVWAQDREGPLPRR